MGNPLLATNWNNILEELGKVRLVPICWLTFRLGQFQVGFPPPVTIANSNGLKFGHLFVTPIEVLLTF